MKAENVKLINVKRASSLYASWDSGIVNLNPLPFAQNIMWFL